MLTAWRRSGPLAFACCLDHAFVCGAHSRTRSFLKNRSFANHPGRRLDSGPVSANPCYQQLRVDASLLLLTRGEPPGWFYFRVLREGSLGAPPALPILEQSTQRLGMHDSGNDRYVPRLFLIGRRFPPIGPYRPDLSVRW